MSTGVADVVLFCCLLTYHYVLCKTNDRVFVTGTATISFMENIGNYVISKKNIFLL